MRNIDPAGLAVFLGYPPPPPEDSDPAWERLWYALMVQDPMMGLPLGGVASAAGPGSTGLLARLLSLLGRGDNVALGATPGSGSPGLWARLLGLLGRGGHDVVTLDATEIRAILSRFQMGRNFPVVGSDDELFCWFEQFRAGGTPVEGTSYPGEIFRLPDGTTVGLRLDSKSGGPAIDFKLTAPDAPGAWPRWLQEEVEVHVQP